tara:strand:- start:42 stop:395 length:354 start_codon:yes stop_codon:yes gene_type:complete
MEIVKDWSDTEIKQAEPSVALQRVLEVMELLEQMETDLRVMPDRQHVRQAFDKNMEALENAKALNTFYEKTIAVYEEAIDAIETSVRQGDGSIGLSNKVLLVIDEMDGKLFALERED